jgi:hypothetical protein
MIYIGKTCTINMQFSVCLSVKSVTLDGQRIDFMLDINVGHQVGKTLYPFLSFFLSSLGAFRSSSMTL